MSAVLLFSGGLDSLIHWRLLGHPATLYFPLGHQYETRELNTLDHLTKIAAAMELPSLMPHIDRRIYLGDAEESDAHIPLRNLLLIMLATLNKEVNTIYLGAVRGESSSDKSGRFFREMSKLVSYHSGRRITVQAPFKHLTKTGLVGLYRKQFPTGPDLGLLLATRSCYSPTPLPNSVAGCGRCNACFRRWVALVNNGLKEDYAASPWTWEALRPKRNWVSLLCRAPASEWVSIVINNWEAWRALRQTDYVHHFQAV